MGVTEIDLVRRAQAGELCAMAVLLERHRARIRAVCVAILGTGPDADDVAQDVFLVALQSVARLVEPDAAGAWLAGIARNLCLQRLRDRRTKSLDVLRAGEDAAFEPDPERLVEDRAVADWVWEALARLSDPLRAVVVLRYFTRASDYDSMASVLGIPIGTVRSRLNEARRKLASLLSEQADRTNGNHAALVRNRRAFFDEIYDEYNRGLDCRRLFSSLTPDAALHTAASAKIIRGPRAIARDIQSDVDAGVRLRVVEVIAGHNITVVEGGFDNPAEDPRHCPPVTTQVFLHAGHAIRGIRLHYAT